MDVSYCYNNAFPAPTCSGGTTADRSKLQWSINNVTGQTTTHTYDAAGAITRVAQPGGTGSPGNNTWAYTYDSRGNRLTATVTGATPSTQTLTVNAGAAALTAVVATGGLALAARAVGLAVTPAGLLLAAQGAFGKGGCP